MGDVHVDIKKNRIHILLTDRTRAELAETVRQIEEASLALKPNFTCLTDFRHTGTLLMENRDLLEKGQRALAEVGIGKALRLITEDQRLSLHFQQLDVVGIGYKIGYATSTKGAERILSAFKREMDQIVKRRRRGGSMFKTLDPQNQSSEALFPDFNEALKKIKHLRRQGNSKAIVVDVNCDITNGPLE
ncbi:MAG: hypothetical protein JEZ11_19045 [Desulfobacterales bacterium]|nr:hypothetical protein [Desulfobacterales bacterium]